MRMPLPSSRLQPDYRFIRTLQAPDHIVPDKARGCYRISSKAFGPSSADGALSGDLEQPLVADGLTAISLYPSVRHAVGAASLTVGQLQLHGLDVCHEPVPTNWYHGGVRGIKNKSIKRTLSNLAIEIVPIDQATAALRDTERQMGVIGGTN